MAFQISPGVNVSEVDLTTVVPSVLTTAGAFAGQFSWGPANQVKLIDSEIVLSKTFGTPDSNSAVSFFTAANFLAYTNALLLVRADCTNAKNAVSTPSGTVTSVTRTAAGTGYTSAPTVIFSAPQDPSGITATGTATLSGGSVTGVTISNGGTGYSGTPTVTFSAPQVSGGTTATGTVVLTGNAVTGITIVSGGTGYTSAPTATITGSGTGATVGTVTISGSSIASITITNAGTGYTSAPTIGFTGGGGGSGATFTTSITTGGVKINNTNDYLSGFADGQGTYGEFVARYPGTLGNSLLVSMADSATFTGWTYASSFSSAPSTSSYASSVGGSNDEMHVILVDQDGVITGTPGTVLEKFAFVSKASDAKQTNGTNNYYKNVINSTSKWIYWTDHPTTGTNWGTAAQVGATGTTFASLGAAITRSLSGGVDDLSATDGQLENGWALFADDATYDISLCPVGPVSATVAQYVISSICEVRLDCVAFVSPRDISSGNPITSTGSTATTAITAYRNLLSSSSYAVLDSGYKYQYDRYNDKYRWVALNGDIAGLCARTDNTNDP